MTVSVDPEAFATLQRLVETLSKNVAVLEDQVTFLRGNNMQLFLQIGTTGNRLERLESFCFLSLREMFTKDFVELMKIGNDTRTHYSDFTDEEFRAKGVNKARFCRIVLTKLNPFGQPSKQLPLLTMQYLRHMGWNEGDIQMAELIKKRTECVCPPTTR